MKKLGAVGVIALLALAVGLLILRGPDWHKVHDAFSAVTWAWVFAAVGLNLLSVLARSVAWDTAIKQSVAPPTPPYRLVFSAFCVGSSRMSSCPPGPESWRGWQCFAGACRVERERPRRSSAPCSRTASSTCSR